MLKIKNNIKIKNIQYFRTKISDIYPIYINDTYRRYISSQPWSSVTLVLYMIVKWPRSSVNGMVSTHCYHLWQLWQLRCHVNLDTTTKQLVCAFICSRLDYCNAILYGPSQSTISPLQRVQNATVCVTLGLMLRDHVHPALKELHWLPVIKQIPYKVAPLMFIVHSNHCSLYHRESIASLSSDPNISPIMLQVGQWTTTFYSTLF